MRWTLCLVTLLLAGCTSAPAPLQPEDLADVQLAAYFAEDAEGMLAPVGDIFWDFGSCVTIPKADLLEAVRSNIEEDRQDFHKYSSHRELVNWDAMDKRSTYDDAFASKCKEFEIQEGDISIHIPATPRSPMHDGWYGVYRPTADGWQMMGSD